MKEYKVETLIYYSKITTDTKHIAKSSKKEIQEKLDEYSKASLIALLDNPFGID